MMIAPRGVPPGLPRRAGLALTDSALARLVDDAPDVGALRLDQRAAARAPLKTLERARDAHPLVLRDPEAPLPAHARPSRALLARLAELGARFRPQAVVLRIEDAARAPDALSMARLARGLRLARAAAETPVLVEADGPAALAWADAVIEAEAGFLLDLASLASSATVATPPREAVGAVQLGAQCRRVGPDGYAETYACAERGVSPALWPRFAALVADIGPVPTFIDAGDGGPRWPLALADAEAADHVLLTGGAARTACAL
mgnify:FL=1